MSSPSSWDGLRKSILRRIGPDEKERKRIGEFVDETEMKLTALLRGSGLRATAEAHGSIVRGTWLRGEKDIDIFLILEPSHDRSDMLRALEVAKGYVGEGWVEAYAEHPYIRASINGFDVEFVPCFRVEPREGLRSATDRSPLHTRFVNERLRPERREDVMLLKQFMRGIGTYGAEIKVGGFSGYLCELLVIGLGSFEGVIAGAARWRHREVVEISVLDVETGALRKKFGNPLIVVDPVDPGRNVASAVSETSMWSFVAAARSFMEKPDEKFFFARADRVDPEELFRDLRDRPSRTLFILVEDDGVSVPDIIWGQLYKAEKAIARFIAKMGFGIIRSAVWSDEATMYLFVFELEDIRIPEAVKVMGPPVELAESGERFLRAHLGTEANVSGPWIEGRRWWVEAKRSYRDVRKLLDSALSRGGRDIGIPEHLSDKMLKGFRILVDDEIVGHIRSDLPEFLHGFLRGRPGWLE